MAMLGNQFSSAILSRRQAPRLAFSRPLPKPASQRLVRDGDDFFDTTPDTILPVTKAWMIFPIPRRSYGEESCFWSALLGRIGGMLH